LHAPEDGHAISHALACRIRDGIEAGGYDLTGTGDIWRYDFCSSVCDLVGETLRLEDPAVADIAVGVMIQVLGSQLAVIRAQIRLERDQLAAFNAAARLVARSLITIVEIQCPFLLSM
jgi:hypothetical protein